jgi:hydrogenase expression/formation protein HypC
MCIGLPMQIVQGDGRGTFALCESRGVRKRVDMLLLGELPPGTWVLEFHGAARRILREDEALQTLDALDALGAALRGETDSAAIDARFADLVGREPQLPEHLRKHA